MIERMLLPLCLAGVLAGPFEIKGDEKASDEAIAKEVGILKGAWKIESRMQNGAKTDPEEIKDRVITFDGAKYVLRDGEDVVVTATFTINPSKEPKWFDLTTTTENDVDKGPTQLGIYKVEGDVVTFCIGSIGGNRPTDFTSKEGSDRTLTTYKRLKK